MQSPTILVIEDSSYLADSLVDMLEMYKYRSLHAASGREGVALAIEHEPDLVLLDIRLPDINGYEVYRQIRATDWGKTARIMVLTASESIENIAKNIDLPREYVLFKPEWSIKNLMHQIEKRLAD
jgi:two-component system KDP operon response regulator KdpE